MSENITIENSVPLPIGSKGSRFRYPFDEMKVGDSFYVLLKERNNKNCYSLQASLYQAAKIWATKNGNGHEFVVRSDSIGVRIWRKK
jgi:hypothetical protein